MNTHGGFWLTVMVPMFKVESYLDQCLQSIIGQADARVEILICDDCSPDNSPIIAQRYVDDFPGQVRMIRHQENRGIAATRNSLLDAAQGDYVWFIDSDDWMRPGAIAAVGDVVRRHSPDLIGCDYRKRRLPKSAFTGRTGRLLTDRDKIVAGICGSRKLYAWVRIARRELWADGLRFPEGRVFEDAAVIPWLALQARSYLHIGRSLIEYRVRPFSIMAGIKNGRGPFDLPSHYDLAGALEGITQTLDRQSEPFTRTRFAASHFIAMEFVKVAGRITAASRGGPGGDEMASRLGEFRAIMERSSPIPFEKLCQLYLRGGRMVAWLRLRRAMMVSGGRAMASTSP